MSLDIEPSLRLVDNTTHWQMSIDIEPSLRLVDNTTHWQISIDIEPSLRPVDNTTHEPSLHTIPCLPNVPTEPAELDMPGLRNCKPRLGLNWAQRWAGGLKIRSTSLNSKRCLELQQTG